MLCTYFSGDGSDSETGAEADSVPSTSHKPTKDITIKPKLLGFYPPAMKKLIMTAKTYLHLALVVDNAFPGRYHSCFGEALDRATQDFIERGVEPGKNYFASLHIPIT